MRGAGLHPRGTPLWRAFLRGRSAADVTLDVFGLYRFAAATLYSSTDIYGKAPVSHRVVLNDYMYTINLDRLVPRDA